MTKKDILGIILFSLLLTLIIVLGIVGCTTVPQTVETASGGSYTPYEVVSSTSTETNNGTVVLIQYGSNGTVNLFCVVAESGDVDCEIR